MTEIRVELQLADGTFTSGLLRAGQSLRDFEAQLLRNNKSLQAAQAHTGRLVDHITRVDGAHKGFVATLRDLSIITGVVSLGISRVMNSANGWAGEIVRVNAEMQRMQTMMRGMSTTNDPFREAAENVRYLREMAMNTPFSIESLNNSFVKLQSTGIDPMNGMLQNLADAIAGFGGSDEQFERATVAITQMSGKGVIQMEELRQQLGEHMPRAVELMARSMGVGVAELLEQIGKGTVAAKPALEALRAEWSRVYDGRAKAQMQTFNGTLKQTETLWMGLLLTMGGFDTETGLHEKGGFFDTIITQLKEINTILASPMANGFAESIGSGLTSVVLLIRDATQAVWTFRRELITLATVAASALAFRVAISGVTSLVGNFGTLRNEMKMVKLEFKAAGSWFATAATGFGSMATAGTAAQMALLGTGAAIKGVGTALMAAMPWVAAIGLAIYTAANYFDIFGNRVRNAYADLKEFGAESRQQALETSEDYIRQLEDRLEGLKFNNFWMPGNKMLPELIANLETQIEEAKAAQQDLIDKAGQREDDKAAQEFRDILARQYEDSQRAYDKEAIRVQQEIDTRKANNDRIVGIEEERRERLYVLRQAQLEDDRDFLEGLQNETREAMSMPDLTEADRAQLDDRAAIIRSELLRIYDEMELLQERGRDGWSIEHLINPDGGAGALTKGEEQLADIRREIMAMQLEIAGASSDMAELNVEIASGDYGSIEEGGAKVGELHDKLRAATRQKEALDKIMAGRTEAEQDAEKARKRALEEQVELLVEAEELRLGRKLTQGEINNMKLDMGLYEGLGSEDKINGFLDGITSEFGNIELSAGTAADAIQGDTFGQATLTAIEKANLELARFNAALGQTSNMADVLNFGFAAGGVGNMGAGGPAAAPVGPEGAILRNTLSYVSKELADFHESIRGSANLMSSNPAAYGTNSNTLQWQSENLTGIRSASGMGAQVHKAAAAAFQGFIDELESTGYKIRSLGGYNYRNKRGGSTLSEHAFGNAIDINPDQNPMGSKLITDMPANISAMAAKYGLSWGGDWRSSKDAMHFEWTGKTPPGAELDNVQAVNTALEGRTQILEQNLQLTESIRNDNSATAEIERANQLKEFENERTRLLQELNSELEHTQAVGDDAGDALERVYDAIRAGELGESRDINDSQYADMVARAKEIDALNDKIAEDKDLQTDIDREALQIEEQRVELNQRLADLQKQSADPNYVPESSTIRQLEQDMDAYIAKMRQLHGEDHRLTQDAILQKQNMLRTARLADATEEANALALETQQVQNSLMTQGQQRMQAMQKRLSEIDAMAERWRAAGMEEVEITRRTEEAKAAIRQQYADTMSPMAAQMREWGDLQGQLAQKSTQWMDSLAGGITDLIMGTGDLRSVINGILKDMINMMVKYMMSGMKGGAGKGGGAGKAAKGGAGKMSGGGAKKMMGVMHQGGIAGGHSFATRRASAAVFAGADRYHTGGIIGPKLLPSEVPIIAQKGEGVFTEEQMQNLAPVGAGSMMVSINSPINVNGSAGTPEQNTDLAKKMRREMEAGMRTVVANEIAKQLRPGNMMNTRSRN